MNNYKLYITHKTTPINLTELNTVLTVVAVAVGNEAGVLKHCHGLHYRRVSRLQCESSLVDDKSKQCQKSRTKPGITDPCPSKQYNACYFV